MPDRIPARADLVWYRKQAKLLLRQLGAADPEALARLDRALGPGRSAPPVLADAQWTIAHEHGARTWAAFAASLAVGEGEGGHESRLRALIAGATDRWKIELTTGLAYDPSTPVVIVVSRRDARFRFGDGGIAALRTGYAG